MDFDPATAYGQPGPDDLVQAMRRMGLLGQLSGDKVLAPIGESLQQQATQIPQLARQSANDEALRKYHEALASAAQTTAGAKQMTAEEMAKNAAAKLGLQANEVEVKPDAWGNNQVFRKYPGVPLPAPAAGGPAAPPASTPGAPLRRPAAGGEAPAPGGLGGPLRAGAGMNDDALNQAADQYATTGKMPNLGRGKAATAIIAEIANRAAQRHPDANLAGNASDYRAGTESVKKQQVLLDITKSWEGTGKANLDVLRGVSQELANAGSPLLNRPLRWLAQNAAGDPTVTKFKAAHAAVVNEYAKILSGATGSAGVTDSSRREAESMMPLDSTPAQIAAAADLLETDAGNRITALSKGLADTRARVTGALAPAEAAAPAAPSGATAVRKFTRVNGKLVEVK